MAYQGYGQAPGYGPPQGYPGQQRPPAGYPGQQLPPAGYPGQHPPAGYPGQRPPAGYPGQQPPPAGYPAGYGQQPPPAGYPGQRPPAGYPGYPGQQPPTSGYPGQQPPTGYPGQQPPTSSYPGQQPPTSSYPGQQPPTSSYPGQQPPPGQQPSAPPSQGCPPGVDPTVYSWFIAVDTDKSGAITATELQQALTNGNWSHFNPETCRLMIGLFDRDNNGTIDLQEFQQLWQYINQWKGVFDRYDRDRSGNIDVSELHTAYTEMGFRVSMQFCQLVIMRFDRMARKSLKFDDFIQSCVMLRSLTDAFRTRDTNLNGIITVSYDDFMTMAISNKP